MQAGLTFSCTCGAVEGQISALAVRNGLRIQCFCKSCRAAEIHGGHPDPAPNPVDIFQVPPHQVALGQGADHLAPFKLSPKGVLRWQATCCGGLIGNTPENPKLAVFGLRTATLPDPAALGPVRARAFVPREGGKPKTDGMGPLITRTIWNMMASRISGNWRDTPFFALGSPIKQPHLFTKEERAALFARLADPAN